MRRLVESPRDDRWLDAAQLIKHAFGLAFTFPGQPVHLRYLFWEPADAPQYPVFAEHRAEIDRFSQAVEGDRITFSGDVLPRPLGVMEQPSTSPWLAAHVARWRERYDVRLS